MNGPLDRQVAAILARVAQLEGQPVSAGAPLQVRLAVTRPDPGGGGYPLPATNPNAYWLRFVDGTFTEAQGTQAITRYDRSANPSVVARNVNGSTAFVPQDTLVLAVRHSGRWWFSYGAGGMNLYPAQLDADLPRGGSAAATIMLWNAGFGVLQAVGAAITAVDVCKSGPAQQEDVCYVVLNPDSQRYEIVELPSVASALFPAKLTANLARGGSANATIMLWNAGLGVLQATGANIVAVDVCSSGPAKQNDVIYVVFNPDSSRYEIVELPNRGTELVLFYLDADLARGGSAAATIRQWAGGGPWAATGAAITVFDSSSQGPAKAGGDVTIVSGVAYLNPDSQRYEIITLVRPEAELYLFYLTADLARGGSAAAKIRTWGGAAWAAGGAAITVVDSSSLGPAKAGTVASKESGVCWKNPDSGRYEIVAVIRPSSILWAKATAKWTNAAGNASTVACNMCTNKTGTLVAGPVPITVYLPRPDGGPKKAIDPNVQTGDVIGYVLDDDGDAVCITDVSDDAIGTVKWWNDVAGNIPRGWRELSGAAGKFIVAVGPGDAYYDPSTLGAAGGASSHTHASHSYTPAGSVSSSASGSATLSGGGISGSGTASVTFGTTGGSATIETDYAVTGITITEHAAHNHNLTADTVNATASGGSVYYWPTSPVTQNFGPQTHTVNEPNSGQGHKHTIDKTAIAGALSGTVSIASIAAGLSLTGTVSLSGITVTSSFTGTPATLTHDTRGHIPPFYALYLIERFE